MPNVTMLVLPVAEPPLVFDDENATVGPTAFNVGNDENSNVLDRTMTLLIGPKPVILAYDKASTILVAEFSPVGITVAGKP